MSRNREKLGNLFYNTEKPGWENNIIVSTMITILFGGSLVACVFGILHILQSFTSNFFYSLIFLIVIIMAGIFFLYMFLICICVILNRFIVHVELYEYGILVRNFHPFKPFPTIVLYENIVEVEEITQDNGVLEVVGVDVQVLKIALKNRKTVEIDQFIVSNEELYYLKTEIEKIVNK